MLRRLHLFHRWAGIGLCVFFAAWFGSGLFMMYVEYPALTRLERLATAPALDFGGARISPAEAAAAVRAGDFDVRGAPRRNVPLVHADPAAPAQFDEIRLSQILGRPAYVLVRAPAQPVVVFADTGEKLGRVSPGQARRAAETYACALNAPPSALKFQATFQSDQWAVSSALNAHRPLHRFALGDAAGTELYVSSRTGEVVRDSTRRERLLNTFGAVTHYLYPHVLRQFPDAWAWVVNIVAASGGVLAVSGLWVGVLRARRRMPTPRSAQQRLVRLHYLAGAGFGVATLTWVFSGWMSMNPGQLNPPRTPSAAQVAAFAGGPLVPAEFVGVPRVPAGTVEAELHRYDRQPFYLATARDGTRRLVAVTPGQAMPQPTAEALIARAPGLMPGVALAEARVLARYDNYYYSRRPENGTAPLPAVRVRFTDAASTWFHLDPSTGRILNRSTATNRLFRHLYNGLHSLDWWWLWSRRPLWDIVVITFCLGGFALSVFGVMLGLRRLRHEFAAAPAGQVNRESGSHPTPFAPPAHPTPRR
jgi:hypothetical protein